jgi:ferrous iron transport protein B
MKTDFNRFIALIGNPNSGKTALFNQLTGMHQKVSNYPGVTVDRKIGKLKLNNNQHIDLLDLPGTYSLTAESFDEQVVTEQVLHWLHSDEKPEVIISVVDASNLSRNLYLTSQVMDLGIPVVIALNMSDRTDEAKRIAEEDIKNMFGAEAAVYVSASQKTGIDALKSTLSFALRPHSANVNHAVKLSNISSITPLIQWLQSEFAYTEEAAIAQGLRLVTRNSTFKLYKNYFKKNNNALDYKLTKLESIVQQSRDAMEKKGISYKIIEATLRYHWLDKQLGSTENARVDKIKESSFSEKLDKVLTHQYMGPIIFVGILYFIFQTIFTFSSYPMEWIDSGVAAFGHSIHQMMSPGILRDLLVEGVIGGVGAILIFLPQILILVFFLAILEDTGYMARVVVMMDKFMTKVGLHGRSVLPLMSGFACAIPGVMATRTIDSWKERLITILIVPLISCSARLPVYAMLIGAFIPSEKVSGIFGLQGLVLVFMYFLGTATALVIAKIFSRFITLKSHSNFVMELPPYRVPLLRSTLYQVYQRARGFLTDAGKIILAISIVLWFLASFPKVQHQETGEMMTKIEASYAGQLGKKMEPFIAPLGFDWKIGIGLVTSFAAREVMVSTLSTIYNVEDGSGEMVNLSRALVNDTNEQTGKKTYSILTALSLLVFYVFAAQCMATFAIVKKETNSWKWPLIMTGYMTSLAYFASLLVFQGGKILGIGG